MSSEKMREDWRECHGKIIKALAHMVNCPQTDEQVEAELIPRGLIMTEVMRIREALDAYAAGQRAAVPDGWVLVPREPTTEMQDAGMGAARVWFGEEIARSGITRSSAIGFFKAMLAAAPSREGA